LPRGDRFAEHSDPRSRGAGGARDEAGRREEAFGSNGGSEELAFDARSQPHPIIIIPHYKPSDQDAIVQGITLHAFLDRVLRGVAFE
jgi:hypothetical protein